jgi:hypothetical protein
MGEAGVHFRRICRAVRFCSVQVLLCFCMRLCSVHASNHVSLMCCHHHCACSDQLKPHDGCGESSSTVPPAVHELDRALE